MKSYNLQMVDKMCRGNQEQVSRMVAVFVDQISESMQEIETAYFEKDFSKIKSLAHKVKPTLTYFGTNALATDFMETEEMLSKEINSSELDLKITNLNKIANEVIVEMKNDFNLIN